MTAIALIAAVARNGVIGDGQAMPWHLPEDLKRFRAVTQGHPVIMGRATWDSLPERFRPLPGRRNIVVTRQAGWQAAGAEAARSPEEALARVAGDERAFVIGGAALYEAMLPLADELVLTEIARDFEGTTRFPAFDRSRFVEVARESHRAAPPNDFDFAWVGYRRSACERQGNAPAALDSRPAVVAQQPPAPRREPAKAATIMSDDSILRHIAALVDEEHRIRAAGTPAGAEAERLRHVGEQLDQCWDLLRQRRAKREFGDDPSTAQARDAGTVERYEG